MKRADTVNLQESTMNDTSETQANSPLNESKKQRNIFYEYRVLMFECQLLITVDDNLIFYPIFSYHIEHENIWSCLDCLREIFVPDISESVISYGAYIE